MKNNSVNIILKRKKKQFFIRQRIKTKFNGSISVLKIYKKNKN